MAQKRRTIETDCIFKENFVGHRGKIRLKRTGTIGGSMEIGTLSPIPLHLINSIINRSPSTGTIV